MKNVDLRMNLLVLLNSFRSISNPITKSRKYMPSWARNSKVWEEVIAVNGFLIASTNPRIKAPKIHGTFIFSRNLPTMNVKTNTMARNKNIFIIIITLHTFYITFNNKS